MNAGADKSVRYLEEGFLGPGNHKLPAPNDATDRKIDRLVYDLYGLTEEEIRIVEGASVASESMA